MCLHPSVLTGGDREGCLVAVRAVGDPPSVLAEKGQFCAAVAVPVVDGEERAVDGAGEAPGAVPGQLHGRQVNFLVESAQPMDDGFARSLGG